MTVRPRHLLLALFLQAALLEACSPTAQEGGGIGGTGIVASVTSGPITDFGSVYVSGEKYDTTGTVFTVDRSTGATELDLKRGMVVRVEASLEVDTVTGQVLRRMADRITYEDSVEGPLQSVDPTGKSLTVMGQTILLTDTTILDDNIPGGSLQQLVPHVDILEVSGFVSGDGVLIASLIQRKAGAPDYEVKGQARQLDPVAGTFRIGTLTIEYGAATLQQLPPTTSPSEWEGLPVHVIGSQLTAETGPSGSGRLRAVSVAPEVLGVQERRRAEIEGFISQQLSPTAFLVGSVQIQVDAQTEFEGGTAADLGPGVRVEVEGFLSGNVLQATRIELNDRVKLEGDVASAPTGDSTTGTFSLRALNGTVVQVTPQTIFRGVGAPTHLGDIVTGDHVVVRGEPSGTHVIATEISRQPASPKAVLLGPILANNAPTLTILGTQVDTSPLSESAFRKADDTIIGRAAFFNAAPPGAIVELEGTSDGLSIQWNEAELQEYGAPTPHSRHRH